jgi:hypothetical protein
MDRYWRKARIAARILAKAPNLTLRDIRIGEMILEDKGVTNRLLDQAVSSLNATKKGKL